MIENKIIVTLAGEGSRFIEQGYIEPKYMLPITINSKKKRIIEFILDGIFNIIRPSQEVNIILNIQNYSQVKEYFSEFINKNNNKNRIKIKFIPLQNGQSYSVLSAFDFSKKDHGFVVFNGDTIVDLNPIKKNILEISNSVSTFLSNSNEYSYISIKGKGGISKIVEKKVISKYATTGIYSFKSRDLYANALESLKKERIYNHNEIYISEVIQKLINNGESFLPVITTIIDLGTPDKYERFCND